MSELEFPAVSSEPFSVEATLDGGRLVVRLRGVADEEVRETVAAAMAATHSEARRHGVDAVVVDLCGLEYMSSACIKSFVTWLAELQQTDATNRYPVRFIADAQLGWQPRTLEALRRLAPDVVTVEG